MKLMGLVFRYAREKRGYTLEQMQTFFEKEEKLGRQTLSLTENGNNQCIHTPKIRRMAEVYGLKPEVMGLLSMVKPDEKVPSDAAMAAWNLVYHLLSDEERADIISRAILEPDYIDPVPVDTPSLPDPAPEVPPEAEPEPEVDPEPELELEFIGDVAEESVYRPVIFKVPDDEYYYDPRG